MFVPVEQPHPWNNEEVMRERVTKLVPPIFPDDLRLVDFVYRPEMAVSILVEKDSLENGIIQRYMGRELRLVI